MTPLKVSTRGKQIVCDSDLHITDINYMAPRYRPGRIIIPATKDRFTNNLPDLSQLLCVPINTDELNNY